MVMEMKNSLRPGSYEGMKGKVLVFSEERGLWTPRTVALKRFTLEIEEGSLKSLRTEVPLTAGFQVEWPLTDAKYPPGAELYPMRLHGHRGSLNLAAQTAKERETWTLALRELSTSLGVNGSTKAQPRQDYGFSSSLVKRTSWGLKRSRYYVLMGASCGLCYLAKPPSAAERDQLRSGNTSACAAWFDLRDAKISRRGRLEFTIESDRTVPRVMTLEARTEELASVWVAALKVARDASATSAAATTTRVAATTTTTTTTRVAATATTATTTAASRETALAAAIQLSRDAPASRREAEDLAAAIKESLLTAASEQSPRRSRVKFENDDMDASLSTSSSSSTQLLRTSSTSSTLSPNRRPAGNKKRGSRCHTPCVTPKTPLTPPWLKEQAEFFGTQEEGNYHRESCSSSLSDAHRHRRHASLPPPPPVPLVTEQWALRARSNGGRVVEFVLVNGPECSLEDLKAAIFASATEFEPSRTRVIFAGKQLLGEKKLGEQGLKDRADLFVVLRPVVPGSSSPSPIARAPAPRTE